MEKYRATRSCALIAPLQCIPSPVAITPSCPHQYNSFFFSGLFLLQRHALCHFSLHMRSHHTQSMVCSMHRSLSTKSQRSSSCGAQNAR